ncbi:CHAT domain-containing protein [Actinomadura oligospora]|uniref:CHAT domain-containing protein n=1 Tax=Actinomadura oligospora TaxID=111804 RepID=UPI0004B0EA6C|nr:CHAT domain-containing protein [Actinomadura oligospora]
MSEWLQALGVLGVVMMAVFGCANWRVPLIERYRMTGFGPGFLIYVLCDVGLSPSGKPGWYEGAGGAAMALAGAAMLWRNWEAHRWGTADADKSAASAGDAESALRHFYKHGTLGSLDHAVQGYQDALHTSVGEGPRLRARSVLLRALRIRYERLHERADLDEAVRIGREGLSARGLKTHRALLLTELSTALRLRHEHTGAAGDLDEAREFGTRAVALLHPRHLSYPLCCSRLSAVLFSVHESTGDLPSLEEALDRLRSAIDSASARGYIRVADEIRMCHLLTRHGRLVQDLGELRVAIELGREVRRRLPPGDPLYSSALHHLSLALRVAHAQRGDTPPADPIRHYETRRAPSLLDEAEEAARQAVLGGASDAPETARYSLNHALVLHAIHRDDPGGGHLDDALAAATSAACHETSDVPTRLRAGLAWSDIALAEGLHAQAVEALEDVIALLPRLAAHELERGDQEQRLAGVPDVAATAAAGALEIGRPDKAAVLLEHGRGVLLARGLDLRTDLGALAGRHPGLADELDGLRQEMTHVTALPGRGEQADAARRLRAGQDERWQDLVGRIRALPGFGDFARPFSADRLRAESEQGPLVYLHVTDRRSDAIVVTPDGFRTVALNITADGVGKWSRRLDDCFRPGVIHDVDAQGPAFDALAWIWDEIVAPILPAAFPADVPPGASPPRLWWVPTGSLVRLPLHAAGHHRDGGPTLMDRVVSSYVPTVRALGTARRRVRPSGDGWLVVAMSDTPDARPLSGALDEARFIERASPGPVTLLADGDATHERVCAELPRHPWVHFACHAVPEAETPSQSRLLLHDHQRTPLTVADISALDLRESWFAYLSACETAVTGPRFHDEAIHLTSAFQLAGFPHVVSTLWRLPDRGAFQLAKALYTELDATGEADDGIARAVHATARRASTEMYPRLPGLWAGLIHVGA